MDIKLIMKSARSAVLELADGGIYRTEENYDILVNGVVVKKAETVITSLYDLKPETEYEVIVKPCCQERQQGGCFCIVRKDGLYCSE